MKESRFPDPPDTDVLTVRSILQGRPILFVEHDNRGHWHFFDGRAVFEGAEMALVPLAQVVALDPRLEEVADLPVGWRAWRDTSDGAWQRESLRTRDRTRARAAEALEEMRRESVTPPPGSPSVVEMLREDRGR